MKSSPLLVLKDSVLTANLTVVRLRTNNLSTGWQGCPIKILSEPLIN